MTLTIIFTVMLFPAVLAVLIPIFPAITYMFIVALIYGIFDAFQHLQAGEIGILGIIFVLSHLVDYSAGVLGAKYAGAEKQSIINGFIGLIVGSILFPPLGGLPTLFLVIFVSEIFLNKSRAAALKAAAGSFAGGV
ncbi:MAG: DUF456 domain-containing protein, partial [Patescibacteria group bacterium]